MKALLDGLDKLASVGVLWAIGIAALVSLLMGKMFAALVLAAVVLGIGARLKRGRAKPAPRS